MLHEFITAHRDTIIARCRAKVATRPAPRAGEGEIEHGVPLFLDQLATALREGPVPDGPIGASAVLHARELRERGFTLAQVVRDYGGICQSIAETATEQGALITPDEFRALNLALDDAIAEAVTEYTRLRDHEGTERLGRFAHDMRDMLHRAVLAYDVLKTGTVAVGGATGGVLARSLVGLGSIVDRQLAEVRLDAKMHHAQTFLARQLVDDVEIIAHLEAGARGLTLSTSFSMDPDVALHADRQIVESVLGNLLQNALKFTRAAGSVSLHAHATEALVFFEVHDQCGGLPTEQIEELFHPFEQRSHDRRGLGLGLAIAHQGALANGGAIRVQNVPGEGCVFTLELPRHPS